MIKGKHFIAGRWIDSPSTFTASHVDGPGHTFADGSPELVDQAVRSAEEAFATYGWINRSERAAFLREIAEQIDARGDDINEIGSQETALTPGRLTVERARTVLQLRLFADHIESGDYLDRRNTPPLPEREPMPRPELRLIQRPIGPVAVFGASNFPLAYSAAGGDTASALAAGCPVVVKGHPAHPGTSDIVAQAIEIAIQKMGMPPGVFSLVNGTTNEVGAAVVQHPLIRAVGFTGSQRGGRALFDLCASRREPIPFYGEMGSVNPIFMLANVLGEQAEELAQGWTGSLTLGAGQFCTNPGLCFVIDGPDADRFEQVATKILNTVEDQTMLTSGIAESFRQGSARLSDHSDTRALIAKPSEKRQVGPVVYVTDGKTWLKDRSLHEEIFGPIGVLIRVTDFEQMLECARSLEGQLTSSVHLSDSDTSEARQLMQILERKAGRLIANGYPTGVEVCEAIVHGGPYPATTNFGGTAVGPFAIRRFLQAVCYQNVPESLLPEDLVID